MASYSRLLAGVGAVLALGLVAGGCAEPVPVHSDLLNETFYTRTVLRANGSKLRSSASYRSSGGGYPPGSEVRVTMFSEIRVDMSINNIPHQMFPVGDDFNVGGIGEFFEKYFVKTPWEVGVAPKEKKKKNGEEPEPPPPEPEGLDDAWRMDKWEKSIAGSVQNGIGAIGMTKEQVFMALGPPFEINFDQPANKLSLATVMEANRWVYYNDNAFLAFFGARRVMTFSNEGKLIQVE